MAAEPGGTAISRLHPWLLWGLVAGSAVLCGSAAVLLGADAASEAGVLSVNTVVAVAYPAVGALILTRHPRHRIGWLMVMPASLAVVTFAAAYAARSGSTWFAWSTLWAWVPGIVALPLLLLLLFPDGRLPSARWRPVLWAVLVTVGAVMAWAALAPGPNPNFPAVQNPIGLPGLPTLDGGPLLAVGILVVVLLTVCLTALLVRFRASRDVERAQLMWFLLAGVVFVLGQVALLVLPAGPGAVVEIVSSLAVPAAVAVAIVRYRLYDIGVVINRSLVYGALTGVVVGVYVAIVTLLGQLFRTGNDLLPSLVATGLIAVAFQPLRQRLQRRVDRLLYGDRADPYALLTLLGERLQSTRVPGEVLPAVTEAIAGALRLPYVAVELVTHGRVVLSSTHGRPAGEVRSLPLTYQSETLGRLLVGAAPGAGFGAAELRMLEDVTRQVGIAAWAVRLSSELQRSREQLVSTREAERRRLRRDLHDGLGAALSGIGFSVDAVRVTLGRDPAAADDLLAAVKDQTRTAIATIRRLVHGLRPPALDELGLAGALRAHVATIADPAVTLELSAGLDALPPAAEVATYWIVVEASTNIARHSGAHRGGVRVELVCEAGDTGVGEVCIEVSDDGVGIAAGSRHGVGLASMRERAEEIGGTLSVEAGPGGGTVVRARLPAPVPSRPVVAVEVT